ncbi:hypothetical protein PWY87_34990 [Kribbella solani]|nr:hypothetical protein [Kribbella solani]
MKEAFREEKDLLDENAQAGSKKRVEDLEQWQVGVGLPPPDGPYSARALFKTVRPEQGARDYKLLSNAAHGSFLTMFLGRQSVMVGSGDHAAGAWWRVLTACAYGYHAAVQVCALQGQAHSENMIMVCQLLEHYTDVYDR